MWNSGSLQCIEKDVLVVLILIDASNIGGASGYGEVRP